MRQEDHTTLSVDDTTPAAPSLETVARTLGYPPSLDPCIVKAFVRVLAETQARSHGDYHAAFPPTSDEREALARAFETALFEDYAEGRS